MKASAGVTPDETGWRVGGRPAWLHAWVADRATLYAIDRRRSAEALESVIGRDYAGYLIHDGWSSYDRFRQATHQQCVGHVLRRVRELEAKATAGAVHYPRALIKLFTEAIHLRNQYRKGKASRSSCVRLVGISKSGSGPWSLGLAWSPLTKPCRGICGTTWTTGLPFWSIRSWSRLMGR